MAQVDVPPRIAEDIAGVHHAALQIEAFPQVLPKIGIVHLYLLMVAMAIALPRIEPVGVKIAIFSDAQ
ncbi:hypothetical protein D3C77_722370 [compost metagenome]